MNKKKIELLRKIEFTLTETLFKIERNSFSNKIIQGIESKILKDFDCSFLQKDSFFIGKLNDFFISKIPHDFLLKIKEEEIKLRKKIHEIQKLENLIIENVDFLYREK